MSGISRRRFLSGLGVATTAAVAAGYGLTVWTGGDPSATPRAPRRLAPGALGLGRQDRTLVVVELGGGNDGLSMVVPYADPAYTSLRPTLAVANTIPLDASIGLHPNLAKLAARFKAGHVAIVEGVGYPDPNLSHFASLAYWWSGTPGDAGSTGWLGRYLDGTVGFEDPLAAVAIGPVPSPALIGERSFATSIVDTSGLQPRLPAWVDSPDELFAAWSKFAPAKTDPVSLFGQLEEAIGLTATARTELNHDLADAGAPGGPADALATDPTAAPTTTVPGQARAATSAVVDSLRLAAELVLADDSPQVVYVSGLGDYDTHQGQAQRHPALMTDLDAGIEAFFTRLGTKSDRALLMTTSEFGRRAAENGSGTDHGTAAPHLVIGSTVKGGRYGQPPSLTQLDERGNLRFGVDFRTLYATALQGWLGVDAEAVIGKGFAPLPIVS